MRIMYVASNPATATDLNLEREITELQRRFAERAAGPISFAAFPGLHFEELPGELGRQRPDVLNIAAHGNTNFLALADQDLSLVPLTAEVLLGFVSPARLPSKGRCVVRSSGSTADPCRPA